MKIAAGPVWHFRDDLWIEREEATPLCRAQAARPIRLKSVHIARRHERIDPDPDELPGKRFEAGSQVAIPVFRIEIEHKITIQRCPQESAHTAGIAELCTATL